MAKPLLNLLTISVFVLARRTQRMGQPGDRVELALVGAADEPTFTGSEEGQGEVERFADALRRRNLPVTAIAIGSGPGILTGQFLVALGPPVIEALAAVAGAWVQARYGRKVRLKVGDIEAEARTTEEVETLLRRAVEFIRGRPQSETELREAGIGWVRDKPDYHVEQLGAG